MTVQDVRRVVTRLDDAGKSVVVEDGPVPEVITMENFPGMKLSLMWGTEQTPRLPLSGADPTSGMESVVVTGPEQSRFMMTLWPPASESADEEFLGANAPDAHAEELFEKMPGMSEVTESEDRMMHTTPSVDYIIIVAGEVWLELDDGVEVHLKTGDVVIQNGTRHAWRNRSTEPCLMASIMIGAHAA